MDRKFFAMNEADVKLCRSTIASEKLIPALLMLC
jgi:hypothetical protein